MTKQEVNLIEQRVSDVLGISSSDKVSLLVEFGNYVLQHRQEILHLVNPSFTDGLELINPNFFTITDADVQNFKHDTQV